jgi:hypothetical protein
LVVAGVADPGETRQPNRRRTQVGDLGYNKRVATRFFAEC